MGLLKLLLSTSAEELGKEFENFVGVNFWTMIFAWVNLLILYLFLKKLLFKPLKNMIDSRQKEIDDMYSDADEAKASAEKLQAEYEERLEGAKEESEQILKNAHRRALAREEEIIREADEKAEKILAHAREEIELDKKRALNEVKDEVSDLALGIASAIIERDVSAREHEAFIDEFIENIGNEI